mmetsp:Transcript_1117/g.2125  ORF Transcript_1117/g.2125 Transcript_1117/m.2125 type:complete len:467 (+) Transcript_1117:47-1447(+)
MEEADLVAFRETHGLDERCMRGLVALSAGDRLVVMDAVHNTKCNNPSAFTWSVVRRVNAEPAAAKLDYVLRHLDEKCLESFRRLARPAQEQIAGRLDAATCRNISAFVFSQIRSLGPSGASPPSVQTSTRGLETLRPMLPLPSARQRSRSPILSRDLSMCSTEDLVAEVQRIHAELAARSARSPHPAQARQGGWPSSQHKAEVQGLTQDAASFAADVSLDVKAQQALAALDAEAQRITVGLVALQAARNPSAVTWATVKKLRETRSEAKQEFIERSLDSEALAAWTNSPEELKAEILSSADLSQVRNVSAFIWSRIRKSEGGSAPGDEANLQELRAYRPTAAATFIKPEYGTIAREDFALGLDERCSAELAMLPQEMQEQVLKEVPPDCRNPSAFVWSKVKQLRSVDGSLARGPKAPGDPLELDERCSLEFNALPEHLQRQILGEVPANCRNPSAFVWSKIKAVKA